MLWGRVTYESMESYWPTIAHGDAEAPPAMRAWAVKLEAKPKYVVSSTRKDFPWTNSRHIAGDLRTGVQNLKDATPDGVLLGSGKLATELDRLDLIDEYKLLARAQSARRVLHAGQHRRASRTSQLSGRGSKRQRSGREDLRPSTTWIANASRISSTVPDTPAEGLTADFRTRHTARAAPCRSAGAWSRRCRKWCADRRLCGGAPRRSPPAWHRGIRRRPARCARARW